MARKAAGETWAEKERRKRAKGINLRVDESELEAFRKIAAEKGMPLAAWIRLVCRRAAGMPTP